MIISLRSCCYRGHRFFKYRVVVRPVYINCLKSTQKSSAKSFVIWSSNTIVTRFLVPFVNRSWGENVNEQLGVYSVHPQSFFKRILMKIAITWDIVETFIRGIQLICIFAPLIILYPITFISAFGKSLWFRMLLLGIEFSGPIIIKLGQWASTRHDLFSQEFCAVLSKLQRDTKPHHWSYTNLCFQEAYGCDWRDIFYFVEDNQEPIGSGCCAQVYKAWVKVERNKTNFSLKNKFHRMTRDNPIFLQKDVIPVAVKVRHPQMEKRLRQDVNILKFLALSLTFFIPELKWLSLPECVNEFSHSMNSQVNFYVEAHNLNSFSNNFKDVNYIKFPSPLWSLTRSNILVETFEDGQQVNAFIKLRQNDDKIKLLAEMGVNTILKMVFLDNFVHGDLHPGNMLVEEKQYLHDDEHSWYSFPWEKSFKDSLTLVILDCGIVSSLNERGRKCLRDVFSAVAHADGERVAELFLQHSNHECSDIPSFKKEISDIVQNALKKTVSLKQVDVSVLMNSVFSSMIHHKVKIDSSFSSVILSILVLEGFGRSLDPTIDVVEKAKPFLYNDFIEDNFLFIFQ